MDRNHSEKYKAVLEPVSPSSRRAWIEIIAISDEHVPSSAVALLAEGVDRNVLGGVVRTF